MENSKQIYEEQKLTLLNYATSMAKSIDNLEDQIGDLKKELKNIYKEIDNLNLLIEKVKYL